MIVKVDIQSDCLKTLYYRNMGKLEKIPRTKNRLIQYSIDKLCQELSSSRGTEYIYTIRYPDDTVSIVTVSGSPIGNLTCK